MERGREGEWECFSSLRFRKSIFPVNRLKKRSLNRQHTVNTETDERRGEIIKTRELALVAAVYMPKTIGFSKGCLCSALRFSWWCNLVQSLWHVTGNAN